jgi:parvulin-like peptidyl-prolyl isomerase
VLFRAALAGLLLVTACTEADGDGGSVVLARVDGEPIHADDLVPSLRHGALGQASPALRRGALEELIDRRLLLRAAATHGITVSGDDVERAFARQQDGYPDEQFARMLEAEGNSADELRRDLRESLILQRLFVQEVVARVAVTDEEVASWLDEHADELARPEQVRAAQIVVKTEDEAASIREQLQAGASFEELAKAASLSPDGKKGGDLGFFAKGEMPPPFDEVCFELKPGRISEVVSSSYGFHVFKVLEHRPAAAPDAEAQRAEATRRLRRDKEAAAQRAFLARLREAAQIEVDEAALERQLGNP